jgi:protein TonB
VAAVAPVEAPAAPPSEGSDVAAAPPVATGGGAQLASHGAEGAVEGVGRSGPQDAEAVIAAYVDLVRKRIESAKRYPGLARSRHVEGTVLALIHLGAGGSVDSVEILDSPSGLLSDPTREAILASGPFPPPPGELRRIRVPVRYALQ